jgi:uncharacterized protein YcfJ
MNNAEQQFLNELDNKFWKAADKLRANIDAANYKHVVLGLIFLKYVSDAFKVRQQECGEFAFKEYAKFGGSVAVGGYGGAAGASAVAGLCLAIGIPTGGLGMLACGVVGALSGGYIGGKAGEMSGEMLGEFGIKAKQPITDFWR